MGAKNKLLLFGILFWANGLIMAQSIQRGKTLLYQGTEQKTPLQNVNINAVGAASVMSDANGEFELQFRTLHAGDDIRFRRIELNGYEVMNQEALDVARIARGQQKNETTQEQVLSIIMIKRETLKELRDGYRSVAAKRYQKQLELSSAQIEELKQQGKLAEAEYNERMSAIEEEYEAKLSKLENYIDKFARIDISDLDADEQKIISLVQTGDFEAALKIYEDQHLAERLKQSREDKAKLESAQAQIAKAAQQTAQENLRLRAAIDRQVTLLFMAGGEENLNKILNIYREVYLADPNHSKARRDYAEMLNAMGQTQEGLQLLMEGLALASDSYTQGEMELEISSLYASLDDNENQLYHILQADSLLWPLRESHYKVITRALPLITSYYLLLFPYMEKEDLLPELMARQKEYWSPDEQDGISLSNYMELLNQLSEYDSENERHEQSIWDAEELLRIGYLLEQQGVHNLYSSYSNACHIFGFEGRETEMKEAAFKAADRIIVEFQRFKSTSEILRILYSLNQVLEAMVMSEHYEEADSILLMMNETPLLQTVEKRYPDYFSGMRGFYRLNIATIHASKSRLDEAESWSREGLDLISADDDYAPAMPYVRPSALAVIANAKGDYAEAKSLYQEAIKAVLESCENQPSGWDKDNICHYYLGMVDACHKSGDAKQARKWLKEAQKYAAFELDRQLINKRENK